MMIDKDYAEISGPLSMDEIARVAYATAKEKGWHDPGMEKTVGDDISLMHSELSEALEDFRAGRKVSEVYYETYAIPEKWVDKLTTFLRGTGLNGEIVENLRSALRLDTPKPCGIPIELADVIIRIGDFCVKHGVDIQGAVEMKLKYNKTRSHRHGGKKL